MSNSVRRIIVGISGASGAVYGVRALQLLRQAGVETHLIATRPGLMTLLHEMDMRPAELKALADHSYNPNDIAAAISSGSFRIDGMLIAPCSIKSMSEIANGITGTLLPRAADVSLKERRPLVLMVRETPLHLGHLRTMAQLSEIGAVIMPPAPAFYAKPATIAELVDHSVGRMLDHFDIDVGTVKRWA